VNFFQIFGENEDQLDAYIYQFFKNSVAGKNIKKAVVEKQVFTFICSTEFFFKLTYFDDHS